MSGGGQTEPEEDGGQEKRKDPLTAWIAITLAALALLGAAIAILQTEASVNESNTARQTTRAAVGALGAGVAEESGIELERSVDAELDATIREQAFLVGRASRAGASATPFDLEALGEEIGADGDRPIRRSREELGRLTLEAERLSLTQETLAETRVTWNDRSTQYTTAIAILAVALFLAGFSLAVEGRLRRALYLLGIAVALATIGFTAYVYSLEVPETPDDAVANTARAVVETDNARYERAVDLLTTAIETDEDFAAPYTRRAIARALAANPDFRATGAIVSDREVFEQAAADVRRALEVGGREDFLTLTLASLLAFSAGQYDLSVRAADEAIQINGEVPDIRLLKSASEVARGDEQAARTTLRGAVELLSGSEPSERTRGLVADYLTYLELVRAGDPDRAELVDELEQQIIALETGFNLGAEPSGTAPARGSVSVENLRYADGRLRLRLAWEDLPTGTQLAAIGFERPVPSGPWVQPAEDALFVDVSSDGARAVSAPIDRACEPTEVRVDVYLNGERVDSVTGPGVAEPTC